MASTPKIHVGQKLFDRRKRLRMSRRTLSIQLGVSEGTIRNWEKGFTTIPDSKKKDIAAQLGMSEKELYFIPYEQAPDGKDALDALVDYLTDKLSEYRQNNSNGGKNNG